MQIIAALDDFTTLELNAQGDYVEVYPDPDGGWDHSPVFLLPGGGQPERVLHRSAQDFN